MAEEKTSEGALCTRMLLLVISCLLSSPELRVSVAIGSAFNKMGAYRFAPQKQLQLPTTPSSQYLIK